ILTIRTHSLTKKKRSQYDDVQPKLHMGIFKRRKPIISMIQFYYLSKIHTTDGSHGLSVYQTVAYIVLYQKRGQYDGASQKLSTEIFEKRKPFTPYDLFYMVCCVRSHCRCVRGRTP